MILKWKKTKKIFSVVIPVYNGEKTIERALASLISNKEYIRDIIIVDDCCTDKTKSVVLKYDISEFLPIKYIRNDSRRGTGYSRKVGIENAEGEWITFIDADDCLTAGSLKYVYDIINDNKDLKILHCQTVYYESGTFNRETIDYSDTSCGGNFYKLDYLNKNELYPHDTLPLVEDQYFNEKIMYFIDYFDFDVNSESVGHFDYPVYEVHHDIDIEESLAIRHWDDYCCKYRLLYKQYLVEDIFKICDNYEEDEYGYVDYNEEDLFGRLYFDYATNFIFSYYLSCCLEYDDDLDFIIDNNLDYFIDAYNFGKNVFENDYEFFNNLFENSPEIIDEIKESAQETTGIYSEINYNFLEFIKKLEEVDSD